MPSSRPPFLVGLGYDLHRLEPLPPSGSGKPLLLAGHHLPADRGPVAHSDGDALLHAVTDAILGALAQPDIGQLFPDNHPDNLNRDSADFLREALRRAERLGYRPSNLDATIILEQPRLAPHKDHVRRRLADLLNLPLDRVNVKAKTHEGVDAVGQGLALEVHAVVLLGRADDAPAL